MAEALDPLFLDFQVALAGRYSIDRELGRGGMGVVYLAREVHLDRLVAIKLLPPERAAEPALRERFLREARLAAKLSHPNIIPIHAVEDSGGFVYYVMTFVDGETLAQRVKKRGPLSSSEGVRVLREVAWALASAHAQGLVHRDVKPDNILLETTTNRVLVADFGIAAAVGDIDGDGVTGTPEFMSPEQALGHEVDARSDLYSLGATAFYAFSGRLPFEGKSHTEVLAKQVTEPAPPLASLGLSITRKVASLVDRCLAKDPAHRPANATALAEQLGVALEQRRELPVALRAFAKRNGRLDGGGTLLLSFGLLAGAIPVSMYYGGAAGFAALAVGSTILPILGLVSAARGLSRMGFAHMDLAPAFKAEMETVREEQAVGRDVAQVAASARRERWLKFGTFASLAVLGTSFTAMVITDLMQVPFSPMAGVLVRFVRTWWSPVFALAATGTSAFGLTHLSLVQRRRDIDTAFWARLWHSPIGRAAFAIAQRLPGSKSAGTSMTHRATELSLGMAAEQLFDSLSKTTRAELGDIPAALHRLQDNAQALRHHLDELNEVLADAGESGVAESYEPVRVERDAMQARLGETVGALETIRLNLLRLHAGSMTVEGLTTYIGLAGDVAAEVERMLEARDEVERSLRFPREIALTPS
ncbi:MAG: serine/threonine-protein kinase [Gemmatimonadaceae bacterium]